MLRPYNKMCACFFGPRSTGNGPATYSSYCSLGNARNTRSSTATVGVKTVAVFPSAKAICLACPLMAGPAGFVPSSEASPGDMEIRVVFGVQFATPRQVSRTKTCRNPLLGEVCVFAFEPAGVFATALGVIATKATKRPDALMEGRMLSVPFKAPSESVEIKVVAGLQEFATPMQVSCT